MASSWIKAKVANSIHKLHNKSHKFLDTILAQKICRGPEACPLKISNPYTAQTLEVRGSIIASQGGDKMDTSMGANRFHKHLLRSEVYALHILIAAPVQKQKLYDACLPTSIMAWPAYSTEYLRVFDQVEWPSPTPMAHRKLQATTATDGCAQCDRYGFAFCPEGVVGSLGLPLV